MNNEILSFKKFPQKIGTDLKKGVVTYLKGTLFIAEFTFNKTALYPDNGTLVAIFGNHLFTELECLSPKKTLAIKEKINYNLTWYSLKISNKTHLYTILKKMQLFFIVFFFLKLSQIKNHFVSKIESFYWKLINHI